MFILLERYVLALPSIGYYVQRTFNSRILIASGYHRYPTPGSQCCTDRRR